MNLKSTYLIAFLLGLCSLTSLLAAPPLVDFNIDDHQRTGQSVLLDASGSSDPNGGDLTFQWRYVNKPLNSNASLENHQDGTATFTSDKNGAYGFELIVRNQSGEESKKLFSISTTTTTGASVLDQQQYDVSILCSLSFGLLGCNKKVVNFSHATPSGSYSLIAAGTDTDRIIMTLNGEQVSFYSDVSGDGIEIFSKDVYLQNENELIIEASGDTGSIVVFQIQENTFTPSTNQAPIFSESVYNIPTNQEEYRFTLNASDSDTSDIVFYEMLDYASYGEASLTGNELKYTAPANYTGEDYIIVRAYDTGIPSKQRLEYIKLLVSQNTPPILAINNFLGHTEVMTQSLNVIDTDQVAISISRQGMGGHATYDSLTGLITYTPHPGFTGIDSFEILGKDNGNFNLETRKTVSVDIQPNTPPLIADLSLATKPNNPIEFELEITDSNPGHIITSVSIGQNPQHGTVEHVLGRIYRYTPNQNYQGLDNIEFIATDNGQTNNTTAKVIQVDVTPSANIPPVIDPAGITALKFNNGTPAKMYIRLAKNPTDPDGTIQKIKWDFGDGNQREVDFAYTGSHPSGRLYHYYEQPGTYTITSTVFDDNNATTSVTKTVTITDSQLPSIRVILDKYSGAAPLAVNFNGSMTTDNGETPDDQLVFTWNFRDGSPIQQGVNLHTISHTYASAGTYYPSVIVEDGENSQIRYFEIIVGGTNNSPWPQAIIKRDKSYGDFPLTVNFDAGDSIDAQGSALGLSYEWTFNDPVSVENLAHGKNVIHTFTRPGVYPVRLRITDAQGTISDAYEYIYVKNPHHNEFKFFAFERDGKTVHLNFEEMYHIAPTTDTYYTIDWGDGAKEMSFGRFRSHEYAADGTYDITVQAEMITGELKTFTQRIILGPQTTKPSYSISLSQHGGIIPYTANYEIQNSNFDMQNSQVLWNFGADGFIKGDTATTSTVSMQHTLQGLATSRTYVTNEFGLSHVHYADINKFTNERPTLKFSINNCVAKAPFTLTFDGTASFDSDGLKAFQWYGHYKNQLIIENQLQFTRLFDTAESFTAPFFLKDNSGDVWNNYMRIVIYDGDPPVDNQAPVVQANYGFWDSHYPQRAFFDTYPSTDDGEVICYQIDTGDGNSFTSTGFFYHDYTTAGDYTVSITAIDNWGKTAVQTYDITVPTTLAGLQTTLEKSKLFSSEYQKWMPMSKPSYKLRKGLYSTENITKTIEEFLK